MRLQRNIEKSWKIYYSCKRAMQRKIKMQSIQKYNLHIKKNHYIFGGYFSLRFWGSLVVEVFLFLKECHRG